MSSKQNSIQIYVIIALTVVLLILAVRLLLLHRELQEMKKEISSEDVEEILEEKSSAGELNIIIDDLTENAEYGYGLVSNKWFFKEFSGKIGLIGASEKLYLIEKLMKYKMLTVKAEENVVRLFPSLIVNNEELDEASNKIEKVCKEMT